ncbi:MAG: hypothetical protein KGO53_04350 [Alphaproteobacteria bacterium]|nr:hypothetical protein [Alphaproteobacteria bacterium]
MNHWIGHAVPDAAGPQAGPARPSMKSLARKISETKSSLRHAQVRAEVMRSRLSELEQMMEQSRTSPVADFRTKLHLGNQWLNLIKSGDAQAVDARNRLLNCCTGFARELICAEHLNSPKDELNRAHMLGRLLYDNKNSHPAARRLFSRLSDKVEA